MSFPECPEILPGLESLQLPGHILQCRNGPIIVLGTEATAVAFNRLHRVALPSHHLLSKACFMQSEGCHGSFFMP
jgi:hypothetical protein